MLSAKWYFRLQQYQVKQINPKMVSAIVNAIGFVLYTSLHWAYWAFDWDFVNSCFKCFFLNENIFISIKISLKFVLKSPTWQQVNIVLGNAFALYRWPAITWTNVDPRCMMTYDGCNKDMTPLQNT